MYYKTPMIKLRLLNCSDPRPLKTVTYFICSSLLDFFFCVHRQLASQCRDRAKTCVIDEKNAKIKIISLRSAPAAFQLFWGSFDKTISIDDYRADKIPSTINIVLILPLIINTIYINVFIINVITQ